MHVLHHERALIANSAFAAGLLAASLAFAQDKKEEEPFWAKGRPKGEVAAKMAPTSRAKPDQGLDSAMAR